MMFQPGRRPVRMAIAALMALAFGVSSSAFAATYEIDALNGAHANRIGTVIDEMTVGSTVGSVNTDYQVGDPGNLGEQEARMWAMFILPPSSPGNTSIASAILTVGSFNESNEGSNIPGLVATPSTNNSWTAASITNTHPVVAAEAKTMLAAGVNGSYSISGGPQVSIDVTSWFQNILGIGLGQPLTVRLSQANGAFDLSGRHLGMGAPQAFPATDPIVRLTIETVPEPTAAGLALFAAASVLAVRRRYRKLAG